MIPFVGITLLILSDITCLHAVQSNECCGRLPDTARDCREICFKLSRTNDQVEQINLLATAPSKCPEHLMEFWSCVERSLPVLLELGTFSGRPCCNLTKTKACREACVKALSVTDVERHCSHSTEDAKLYECIERQKDGEKCCGKSITIDSLTCKATCWNMYLTNTITSSESKRQLRHHCTGRNKEVVQCLHKQTRTTRQSSSSEGLHCCELRKNETCRRVCQETLQSAETQDEMMNRVIAACGNANPSDPLYQCFLKQGESGPIDPISGIVDSAKLHCCEKATTRGCGELCVKTHASKWSIIQKFEQNCGYLSPSISSQESAMHSCLKDVEEPCQLGCSGLQYCTSMNNRVTEHFRSCNADADMAAQKDIFMWQKGEISLPGISIPVKDIRTCEPEMWKAIACAYQIKPCYRKPVPLEICREDCVYIMNKCVDTSRLNGHTDVTDLCKRLPLTSSENCISVKKYTGAESSPYKSNSHLEVTQPCKSNPCRDDEVCVIYRRKCRHSNTCPHYVCKKGCKMGQVSKVLIPYGSDVIIPIYKNGEVSGSCIKYEVCHCAHTGNFGKSCEPIKCVQNDQCRIEGTMTTYPHDYHHSEDCNDCVCHAGQSVCSRRQCAADPNLVTFTGIQNCDCAVTYKPVCASNGRTYPSGCIAFCAGQSEYIGGACTDHSPCRNNPCEKGYQCVPNRQVCIGLKRNTPCLQYSCVSLLECNHHHHEPVCDTEGVEYTNDCLLLKKGKTLAYRGHCVIKQCSSSGQVCGHDGETYMNECTALAARITVDYQGPCKTLAYVSAAISQTSSKTQCENVVCKAVLPAVCQGIIPPWSCCPICAAELRVLNSDTLARISIYVKRGPVSVRKILDTLSIMVTVSECDVFGYLGLDGDLVILLTTIVNNPTPLQVTACFKEAERFEYLIQSRSPSITSNMLLTPLLYAKLRTSDMFWTSGSAAFYTQPLSVIVTLVLLHCIHRVMRIL